MILHQVNIDARDDLLEQEINKWHTEHTAGWENMGKQLQHAMVSIICTYCFQHKVDNLLKAIDSAFEKLAPSFLPPANKTTGHKLNYLHSAQKLIGMKQGKAKGNVLNLHREFTDHLDQKEKAMLGGIGALVGDCFWVLNKNSNALCSPLDSE